MESGVAAVNGRLIHRTAQVPGPIEAVWAALTTRAGVLTFFAPDARIEPVAGGAYEVYFHVFRAYGLRGSEGCRVMIIDPPRHLRHTWNAPPDLADVRDHQTVIDWYLTEDGDQVTSVELYHYGWELGGQWEDAFRYFQDAWDVILGRLARRFSEGPMDWEPVVARWREAVER